MRSLVFPFSIALGSAACSTVTVLENEGGGGAGSATVITVVTGSTGATSEASTTDATTGGQGGEDSDYPQGMFDCEFEPACEPVFIYQGDASGGLRCTAELALSGEPGVVIEESTDGGINPTTSQLLVLYASDGRSAFAQTRSKSCPSCGWEPNPATHVLRCDVVVSPEVAAACALGTDGCAATPSETLADDCVVEEIPHCATPAGFLP